MQPKTIVGTRLTACSTALAIVSAVFVGISPAQAYVSNRCKWGSQPIKVDTRYVNGNFYTAIKQAIANYDSATDISMTYVDASGPGFAC